MNVIPHVTKLLWGPLYFVLDVAWQNRIAGVVLAAILFLCMISVVLRPAGWTLALSILAILAWMFVGAVGSGLDV